MKIARLALPIAAILCSVTLAALLIWWKVQSRSSLPFEDTPENRAAIIKEATENGWITAAADSEGRDYYFIGSSKYMWPVTAEDLEYMDYIRLWQNNKIQAQSGRSGKGTYHRIRNGVYKTDTGEKVELVGQFVAPTKRDPDPEAKRSE